MNRKLMTGTLCLAMGALLSNCTNEELVDTGREVKGNYTLTASMDNSDTRTNVTDKHIMLWNAGDNIKVANDNAVKATMELTDGKETTTATFKGVIASTTTLTYAFYPATATYANKVMTYTFPATYADISQSNAPMYGTIASNSKTVQFKALCGMLRLNFKNMPTGQEKSIKLTSKNGNITGEATVDLSKPTPALSVPSSEGKVVTVTVPQATSTNFFIDIPLPAGTYSNGIEVELTGVGNTAATLLVKGGSEIKAGTILEMPDITYSSIDGETPSLSLAKENIKEAETALSSGASSVTIKGIDTSSAQETDRTLTIPAATSIDTPVFIGIESLKATDAAPAIFKAPSDESTAPKEVTVAIGAVADDAAPSVTLEMTKSTVTLGTTAATTTYNKVIASTALNTLIIEKGVTVKELTVKEGNVVIRGTVTKLTIDGSANTTKVNIEGEGACYSVTDSRDSKATVLATWDGVSVRKPAFEDEAGYSVIGGAAELAYLQSKNIPFEGAGSALPNTITKNTKLAVDIDLSEKPWAGMVLADEFTFDGGSHIISNVLVNQFALSENGIYTNPACVGLFAATKKNAVIKDITVKKFTATGEAANAKWNGALVGYSYGASTYTNCKADGVTIKSSQKNSYRVGGLIGFIANVSGVAVTLEGCSAINVEITAEFAVGGLIGSIQGSANRTFTNCTTSNVTLGITPESTALIGGFSGTTYYASKAWAGYMSNFIGDVAIGKSTLTLTNCTTKKALSSEQTTAFGYNEMIDFSKPTAGNLPAEEIKAIQDEAKEKGTYYSLKDATNPLICAQIDGGIIVVGDQTLKSGTDYNLFTEIVKE